MRHLVPEKDLDRELDRLWAERKAQKRDARALWGEVLEQPKEHFRVSQPGNLKGVSE